MYDISETENKFLCLMSYVYVMSVSVCVTHPVTSKSQIHT